MKGYKAFDKDFKCNGFQFEVGKRYEHDGELRICEKGFHYCELPLDVLDYKDLIGSKFAEVEADGESRTEGNKSVTAKIHIKKELGIAELIKSHIEILFSFAFKNDKESKATVSDKKEDKLAASGDSSQLAASGDYSKLAASGDYSQLAASGYYSKLAASGYSSKLAADGKFSVAAGIGINNIAKGADGNFLVLAEWKYDEKISRWKPIAVKVGQVGKDLKADTYYKLENGEFVEVK